MQVVAEGVETQQQVALLQAMQCDYAQGDLFAKPWPKAEAYLRGMPRQHA